MQRGMASEIDQRSQHPAIERVEPGHPQLRIDRPFRAQHLRRLLQVAQLLQPGVQHHPVGFGHHSAVMMTFINQGPPQQHPGWLHRLVRLLDAIGNKPRQGIQVVLVVRPTHGDEGRTVVVARADHHRIAIDPRPPRRLGNGHISQVATDLHQVDANNGNRPTAALGHQRPGQQRVIGTQAGVETRTGHDRPDRRRYIHLGKTNLQSSRPRLAGLNQRGTGQQNQRNAQAQYTSHRRSLLTVHVSCLRWLPYGVVCPTG